MHSSSPAINSHSIPPTGIDFNLGTIGRITGHQVARIGPWVLQRDVFAALVETNPGLPRPGRDLDAKLLDVPHGMPLVLLAAIHHGVAYYFICDTTEQPSRAALKWVNKLGRLEIGFVDKTGTPLWSALHLGEDIRQRLAEKLESHSGPRHSTRNSWRDRLGLLLISLPGLLFKGESDAIHCTRHAAVLLSGNRDAHTCRVLRVPTRATA